METLPGDEAKWMWRVDEREKIRGRKRSEKKKIQFLPKQ